MRVVSARQSPSTTGRAISAMSDLSAISSAGEQLRNTSHRPGQGSPSRERAAREVSVEPRPERPLGGVSTAALSDRLGSIAVVSKTTLYEKAANPCTSATAKSLAGVQGGRRSLVAGTVVTRARAQPEPGAAAAADWLLREGSLPVRVGTSGPVRAAHRARYPRCCAPRGLARTLSLPIYT
jgi:hypothetical protein